MSAQEDVYKHLKDTEDLFSLFSQTLGSEGWREHGRTGGIQYLLKEGKDGKVCDEVI